MTTSRGKKLALDLLVLLFLPAFLIAAVLPARRRLLIWGAAPLKCNHYWSEALKAAGRPSMTIMAVLYGINRREDFDWYFEDFAPSFLPRPIRQGVGTCLAFLFVLRRGQVLHTNYFGFALSLSAWWRLESWFLRLAGVKTVVMAYGADAYLYSRIVDTSLRYGLLASYPDLARMERSTAAKVDHWNAHADCVITGLMIDGLGRWDVTLNQYFVVDLDAWTARAGSSPNDGRNGPVRILHTPNHRGFKGTEFVVDAVEQLKAEGLQVELVMLEKVQNDQVRVIMGEVDILAEQFIATGYAMSGIEGMACGLPVLSNLEHDAYTRVYRRYGFLDECPILSTTPETLADHLRLLVTQPELRRILGTAGRRYVEKYHSYAMAQYLFGSIHARIVEGKDVDLMRLFHPLLSDYNRRAPKVEHPLVDSRLPDGWIPPRC